MDDDVHRIVMTDPSLAQRLCLPNTGSPTGLYTFLDGVPEHNHRLMDVGVAPWWTFERVISSFWRPVAWLTHWVDYSLWPTSPVMMHLQSILWYAALIGVVAALYSSVMPAGVAAGIAILFYAIDETHVIPAGWIANRNALIAAVMGMLAIVIHDRWRRDGWHIGAVLGPALLAMSLLSSEGGVGTLAYLGAYALFLDKGTWRGRFGALIPYAVVVIVWRIAWANLGFGGAGGGLDYVDPLAEPLRFAWAFLERAPVLILAQIAWPPADVAVFAGSRAILLIVAGALCTLAFLWFLVIPLVRTDAASRFWVLATGLSLVPACASLPSDRNLLFVGVGAMGLIARFVGVAFCWDDMPGIQQLQSATERASKHTMTPLRFLACTLFFFHAVVSPIALTLRAPSPLGWGAITRQLHVTLPLDESIGEQDVLVLSAPSTLHVGHLPIRRALAGQSVPRHTRMLSAGQAAATLHRPDSQTLIVTPEGGFLEQVADRVYRSLDHPMTLGQRIELSGVTVEVTALTIDGRPAEATFRFEVPLEDPSLRWLQWQAGKFIPFDPPDVGKTVTLSAPAPTLF
ncbi:MAG: hypothetical protein JSU63_03495 [Phycisphaerales bacterium]|nr:MAG: hypothetical protein JSU63_03495 [Phycisphaerales bacterium]